MFAGIHGVQRSGKSYFCIRTCIDFLRNTKRDLYTNLPVNPDFMAQFVCGKKLRNPDKYYDLFKRIHIFKTFDSFGEARSFAKKIGIFGALVVLLENISLIFLKSI